MLQTITKERMLLPLLWLGILLGLHNLLQAQTCPSGWTSTTGTIYPENAAGTATVGSINNIVFGGADGNFVRADAGIVVNFGQSLAAGGTVDIVASAINNTNAANFNVSFSADGINYSAVTLKTVPINTTMTTYTVTAPSVFQYVKIVSVSSNLTYFDAISYNGTYCKAPIVNYASCGSGESQTWRMVEPLVAGTVGINPNNIINGPDGLNSDITTATQSLVSKYAKAFAAGDTIVITGYKYVSTQVGDFQVLTSMDGVNFTALASTAFTNSPPALQIIKIAATQPFQYVKVVRTGNGFIHQQKLILK